MITIIGTGMPSTYPFPNQANSLEFASKPVPIGFPSVNTNVAPRSMVMVARVTINGCSFPLDISTPFKAPTTNPTIKATGIAIIESTPLASIIAATAPENPKIEPTDKSIPPVSITKVIPVAITALIEVCLRMLSIFEVVINLLFINATITENTISPIKD